MAAKRLRLFAGPNGSGKTTLIRAVGNYFRLGCYLNADEVEKELQATGQLDLAPYCQKAPTEEELYRFWQTSGWPELMGLALTDFFLSAHTLSLERPSDPYFSAFLCDFLREKLLGEGRSFSFESVVSHPSKVELLDRAQRAGYKTYLYFITTEDAEINVARVENRVRKGGHAVEPTKIRARYERSLTLLPQILRKSSRAFLFDNSGAERVWVAETDWEGNLDLKTDYIPNWLTNYLLGSQTGGIED